MYIDDTNEFIELIKKIKSESFFNFIKSRNDNTQPEWVEESKDERWRIENSIYKCKVFKIFDVEDKKEDVDAYIGLKSNIAELLGYNEGIVFSHLAPKTDNLDDFKNNLKSELFHSYLPETDFLDMVLMTRIVEEGHDSYFSTVTDENREYVETLVKRMESTS